MQVHITGDAGPFVYCSALVSLHSLMLATGPYYVPHVSIDVQAIHTNNIFSSAMRAVGGPQVNFAYESQMDQLAHEIGMDPLTFRRINYLLPGQSLPNGQVIQGTVLLADLAEHPLEALHYMPAVVQTRSKKIRRSSCANVLGYR